MRPGVVAALILGLLPSLSTGQGASGDSRFGAQVESVLSRARRRDGWNLGSAPGRGSLFFWEFKYFNFHAPEGSGNIAFFTAAPRYSRQMIAIAHIYTDRQILTYRKAFDLSCVKASETSPELSLCGQGGIRVVGPDRYRIALRIGSSVWDLEVRGEVVRDQALRVRLDGWLASEMSWTPVFVRAAAGGTIRLGDKTLELRDAPAYHDLNWGRWHPSRQPYRWLHFSGTDSNGSPLDVLLGDFYHNRSQASGLIVRTAEGERTYGRGEFGFTALKKGRSKTTRFGFKETGEAALVRLADPGFAEGDHEIPTAFSIAAKDGSFSLAAETVVNDAAGPRIPILLKPFIGGFTIDEQLIRVRAAYRTSSGEERLAEGLGEFQTIGQ